jgi:hypothetical protein
MSEDNKNAQDNIKPVDDVKTNVKNTEIKLYIETPSTIILRKKSDVDININRLNFPTTNPFSKEKIDHIELRDIAVIFNNSIMLSKVMKYYLYELERTNINFYKENMNDKNIKVLLPGREIIEMPHAKLIYLVNVNIIDICLKLLHKFLNSMTIEQVSSAIKILNEFQNNLCQTAYLKRKHPRFSIWK